jgi:hypothetical protein
LQLVAQSSQLPPTEFLSYIYKGIKNGKSISFEINPFIGYSKARKTNQPVLLATNPSTSTQHQILNLLIKQKITVRLKARA